MTTGTTVNGCPRCGWPRNEIFEVLSRHLTSKGVVSYTRCACGEIEMRFQPYGGEAVVGAHSDPGSHH